MAVSSINITIEQGEDFTATYDVKNPDESIASLADYSAVATLKKHPEATDKTQFTTVLTVSTAVVTISLSNSLTAALKPGRYYYDVFLISSGGKRTKIIEGNALVNGSATLPT